MIVNRRPIPHRTRYSVARKANRIRFFDLQEEIRIENQMPFLLKDEIESSSSKIFHKIPTVKGKKVN